MRLWKAMTKNHLVGGVLWSLIGGYGIGLLFLALSVAHQTATLLAVSLLASGLINLALHHHAASNECKNLLLTAALVSLVIGIAIALAVGINAFASVATVLIIAAALVAIAKASRKKKKKD